jgi:hypothetical protein
VGAKSTIYQKRGRGESAYEEEGKEEEEEMVGAKGKWE